MTGATLRKHAIQRTDKAPVPWLASPLRTASLFLKAGVGRCWSAHPITCNWIWHALLPLLSGHVGRAPQCIPPRERATAVSLTTSGMYMGSAAAIQWMPGVAMRYGAAAITRLNGCLGLAWVVLWFWAGRLLPPRCALLVQMCNGSFANVCQASQMQMCKVHLRSYRAVMPSVILPT